MKSIKDYQDIEKAPVKDDTDEEVIKFREALEKEL